MKVYLDDERPVPPGWHLVRWPDEVIDLLRGGEVTEVSLDHDLGDDDRGTGYDVIVWIEEAVATGDFVPPALTVHSANNSARQRMEAGIASIARLVRQRQERIDATSSAEFVRRVLADERQVKSVLAVLEARPPDDETAALVLVAHADGQAPDWLAAVLLGRLRAPSGYPVLRDILARAPGSLAEDYAACAMVRTAGDGARADLSEALIHGERRRTREGAAAGLALLADPTLVPTILAARRAGRILRDCAASTLADLRMPADEVIAMLRGADLEERALAIRIVAAQLASPNLGLADRELAQVAHEALTADRLLLEESRRHDLLAKLSTCLSGH